MTPPNRKHSYVEDELRDCKRNAKTDKEKFGAEIAASAATVKFLNSKISKLEDEAQEKEKNIARLRTTRDRQEANMEDLRTEVQELKLQISNRRKALEDRLAQTRTQGQRVQLPSPGVAYASDSDHSIELPPSFSRGPHRSMDHGNPERYPSTAVIPLASTVLRMGTTEFVPESVRHARRLDLTRSRQSSKGIWSSFADAASPGRKKISLSRLRPAARSQTIQHVFSLSLGAGKDVIVLSFENGTARIGDDPSQSQPQTGESLTSIPSQQTKWKESSEGELQVRKSPGRKNRLEVEGIDLELLMRGGERQLEEVKSPLPVINVKSPLSPARSEKGAFSDQASKVKLIRIDNGDAATLPPSENVTTVAEQPSDVSSMEGKNPETKPAIKNGGASSSSKQAIPAAEKISDPRSKPHETRVPISTQSAKNTVPFRMQIQTLPAFTLSTKGQAPAAAKTAKITKPRMKVRPKRGSVYQPSVKAMTTKRGRSSSHELPMQLSPDPSPKVSSDIQLTERIKQLELDNARLHFALQQHTGNGITGFKPRGSIDSASQLHSHEDSLDSSTPKRYSINGLMTPRGPVKPSERGSRTTQSAFLSENADIDEIDSNFSFGTDDSNDLDNPDVQETSELEGAATQRARRRPRHSTILLKKLLTNPSRFKKVQPAGRRAVNKFVFQIYQDLLQIYHDSIQSFETVFHLKHRFVCVVVA